MHRRNAAERAIQTFKGHVISTLAGVSDNFLINQWDQLLPQMVTTIAILRSSNVVPNVSAYAYHHGQLGFNRTPLAPMGCAVQFHNKPTKRRSWGEHSSDGWYIGIAPEHYRCHKIFVKATRAIRSSDTVFFKHKYITQPAITPADAIVKAYQDLLHAIWGIKNVKGSAHLEALQCIETTLTPPTHSTTQTLPTTHHRKPVPQQHPRVQIVLPNTNTRLIVTPNTNTATNAAPPRVEESLEFPRVEDDDTTQVAPQLSPIETAPHKSIADRVKNRHHQPETTPPESIAQRVAMRRREQAAPVLDVDTGKLLEYRALLKHPKFRAAWSTSAANEFGRLAQGVGGRVQGTNTIQFIHKNDVPTDRFKDVTYLRMVCQVRTEKKESNRTRATVGGNLINCEDDLGTPTADLLLITKNLTV
jgi:hypothetical protein